MKKKKTIVYIVPHLSTGGMPQYLFKQIESVINDFDVYCIEWDNVTGGVLVVQRNRIQNLLGDKLITLGQDKKELFPILDRIKPDIVHLHESPELFISEEVAVRLYATTRHYVILETSHDSTFDISQKQHFPDKFLLVSPYQVDRYSHLNIPCELVLYPLEPRTRTKTREEALAHLGLDPTLKHVINVGLFTPNKNQGEILEYARTLQHYPIQFHFIGNQAENFADYWKPLMANFPPNCKWWNERSDVDAFYEAADLFVFTSKYETMPLVVLEAASWNIPSLIHNLSSYAGTFDHYSNIQYLTDDVQKNAQTIAETLMTTKKSSRVYYTQNGQEYLEELDYLSSADLTLKKYGDAAGQYYATFIYKELEPGDFTINEGDVFVDIGSNIGISSLYALSKGAKEVHSFEPDARLRSIYAKNVPNAIVHPYAVSHKHEEIKLYHWPYNDRNPGPMYTVHSLTLKEVLSKVNTRINYLKIDIEGYETHLFDDLTSEDCHLIDKMMVEYHDINTVDAFCEKLKRLGFTIVHTQKGYQAWVYARFTGGVTDERNAKLKAHLDSNICATKDTLASMVNTLSPNGVGVEIGVLRGAYSKEILQRWTYGTLYLVDTWRHISSYIDMNGQDDAYHYDCMVKTCESIKPWQNRAHMIRMGSADAAKMFPDEYFDFIYIDADHAYEAVVNDLAVWWPKIKKGGLFCGDDYIPDNGDIWLVNGDKSTYAGKFGVRQAVDEFAAKHNLPIYSTTEQIYWKQWYTFKPY